MRSLVMIGFVLGLGACQPQGLKIAEVAKDAPQGAPAIAAKPAAASCDAKGHATWSAGEAYSVDSLTLGATCEKGVALLVVSDKDGAPIFTWSGRVTDIFDLMEAKDATAMAPALTKWIDQSESTLTASDKLPDWKKGDKNPGQGDEFPFMPASGIDRETYLGIRRSKLHVFCFTQGHESMDCLYLRDGVLEELGLQTFPG
jgi:hypothetical protein